MSTAPTDWRAKADAVFRLLRWDKPAGRLILMIPALWGVFAAAGGSPSPLLVLVMVVGTIATSAAGCVINDLWDRDIDPLVERTRARPLASRELAVPVAVVTFAVSLLCAWGLTFFLNPFTFWLCVAAVPVIALYPGAKRVFPVPQLVLSLAWGFAALISWSAVTGGLETPAWWLWGATVLWTLGFDTVYALSDREDDLKIGINSSAIFFGRFTPEAIAAFFAGAALCLAVVGYQLELGSIFYVCLIVATLFWWREYRSLVTGDDPARFNRIFNENVTVGFVILTGLIGGTLI
ncbi:4-hydroxybenzoate solanesyltransferase [Gloeobacter violaceus]|uniref:4-hydroxybenzoate solanesyltransferase n=1 Tax=Gloeobacter violaceus (strain ATCC 29082 / PCC 7421) TaxID=251221 RepID=Q7NFU6_GLOVI|nr:4-hydroxybenzoate solanesyltransferase [Gloeobacter violaceus]BAC91369.1 4-hydroxybenzoate-octaprenyl transferase [Gloeobacter violaceus PCC 7421]